MFEIKSFYENTFQFSKTEIISTQLILYIIKVNMGFFMKYVIKYIDVIY